MYVGRRGFSNIFIGIIIAIIFVGAAGTFLVSKRTVVPENDRPSAEEELPVAQEKYHRRCPRWKTLFYHQRQGRKKKPSLKDWAIYVLTKKNASLSVGITGKYARVLQGKGH